VFVLGSFREVLPIEGVQTWIVDPPYNIKYNYNSSFKDNLDAEQYSLMIYDLLELAYDSTKDNGSFFLINYPDIIAELFIDIKRSRWNVHQWITWVYPSNIGMSNRKFTRASRTVLWLSKGEPKVNISAVQQPYKNPKDKRIMGQMAKGKTGTNLYDWWDINLCKNVSKDKNDYVNQIPAELLRRLILSTTEEGDLVADGMCGSGSTVVAAESLGRRGFGCDINENLLPIWEKHRGV